MKHIKYIRVSRIIVALITSLLTACSASSPHRDSSAVEATAVSQTPAMRNLDLEGAHNFRDLGGYKTTDGRTLKWGVLYRSDNLAHLTDTDLELIGSLNLKQVVDFRLPREREEEPDLLPVNTSAKLVLMTVNSDSPQLGSLEQSLLAGGGAGDAGKFMVEVNRVLVSDNLDIFRGFILNLANDDNLPLLFHCTSGKDRTGFAAAITLLALGVPRETVMDDYLLSNQYTAHAIETRLPELAAKLNLPADSLLPLMGVERRYLEASFELMEQNYGSIENYLSVGLGIDEELWEKLRNNLLVP